MYFNVNTFHPCQCGTLANHSNGINRDVTRLHISRIVMKPVLLARVMLAICVNVLLYASVPSLHDCFVIWNIGVLMKTLRPKPRTNDDGCCERNRLRSSLSTKWAACSLFSSHLPIIFVGTLNLSVCLYGNVCIFLRFNSHPIYANGKKIHYCHLI